MLRRLTTRLYHNADLLLSFMALCRAGNQVLGRAVEATLQRELPAYDPLFEALLAIGLHGEPLLFIAASRAAGCRLVCRRLIAGRQSPMLSGCTWSILNGVKR